MAWNKDTQGGGGSGKDAVSVKEGNVEFFLFTETPTTVRFLTEDITAEDIMSERSVPREQAVEILRTEVARKKWIEPISYWEHSVPSIPGQRFFSTVPCIGNRAGCPLCAENQTKKDAGIAENKLLPFPIRKRFMVPAYFYELDRVLFVRGNEDFFDDIAKYINKNGSDVSFDIWRTGKGFETKYKSTFNGKADPVNPEISVLGPDAVDYFLEVGEVNQRIAIKGALTQKQPTEPAANPAAQSDDSPGGFVIPFGTHKGKTIAEVAEIDAKYLEFLASNGAGALKEAVNKFLGK